MTADPLVTSGNLWTTGAPGLRRSVLADRAGDLAAASSGAILLAEVPYSTMVSLRVDPEGSAAEAVTEALHAPLPAPGEVTSYGERAVLWLGPDEFLVLGPDGDLPLFLPPLSEAMAGVRGAVVDVSANRTTVAISGPRAEELLNKGITLDLHPQVFTPGRCASTTLARTNVIVRRTAPGAFQLLVRCSFANYLADWLTDAAQEYRD